MRKKYNIKPYYWDNAKKFLKKNDAILKKVIEEVDNENFLTINSTPFQTLANAIIGQQISVAAASSVLKKLKSKINGFSPSKINNASTAVLKNSGLSRQKIEYIKLLAQKFINEPIYFYGLKKLSDKEIIENLCRLKGIGEWTAQMYLIFFQLTTKLVSKGCSNGF